jgi:hypothetical protein
MKIANKTKLWNSCDDLWYLKFSFRWNGSENFKLKIETTKNGYEKLLIDLSSKLKYLWDLWWIKLLYREVLLKRKNWMKWRKCGCGDRRNEEGAGGTAKLGSNHTCCFIFMWLIKYYFI